MGLAGIVRAVNDLTPTLIPSPNGRRREAPEPPEEVGEG